MRGEVIYFFTRATLVENVDILIALNIRLAFMIRNI